MSVIWHDLECGGYTEDLPLWRSLADEHGDPILEIGAGTGRVSLDLARRGHDVTALDRDPALLAELVRRAEGLRLATVCADARRFALGRRFAVCLVPMQTIQLLGGPAGRAEFLHRARAHLHEGVLAIAITGTLESFEVAAGSVVPVPDMCERDGVVYASQPTAVRVRPDAFILERVRQTVFASGERSVSNDVTALDRVSASELEREAAAAGFNPAGRARIPATEEYVGSAVVMLGG